MGFYVDILRCGDGTCYTGQTSDLGRRIHEHGVGLAAYTAKRRPVTCVRAEDMRSRETACALEKQLKGWSRAKKEAFIRGDWEALPALSRSRSRSAA